MFLFLKDSSYILQVNEYNVLIYKRGMLIKFHFLPALQTIATAVVSHGYRNSSE